MSSNEPIKLRIPHQDLVEFPAFSLTAEHANRWASELPMANSDEVAQQLRIALSDLNRVDIAPDLRFQIMEALRPTVHMAMSTLSKYYLNQPIVLPEEPRKAVRLAQSLCDLMATSYTITAIQTIQRRDSITSAKPAKLVCEAVHRAVTTSSLKLLLTYQLYQPTEANVWLEIHQLYLLAERQQLISQLVADDIVGECNINTAYIRVLMLGCCKPNQLRQQDLAAVFKRLKDWVQYTELESAGEGDGLFLVDSASDQPPLYGSLFRENPGSRCRLIGTDALITHLKKVRKDVGERAILFDKDTAVSPNVLDHLITSWGVMSKRNFDRTPAQGKLWVSVGLSNTHYYVSGGISFDHLISAGGSEVLEDGTNKSVSSDSEAREKDLWDSAFTSDEEKSVDMEDIKFHIREAGTQGNRNTRERHPVFPVRMFNVSPGGYCLEWPSNIPSPIRTGELISVREVDNAAWSIAVIRWVNQVNNDTTLLGVELLSPRATPYGARVHYKTGDVGDIMRALLLPGIKLVGQPNTLITPRVGFKDRQKVTLILNGEESYIQLNKKIAATATYNQFEFRKLQHLETVAAQDKSDVINTEFESLWNNI